MFELFKNLFTQDNTQLIEALKNTPFLVDVRTPAEFSGGSVKGAINIPLDTLPKHLSKFKDQNNIVVFCRSGARSGQAKTFLEKNGLTVINGGGFENVKSALIEAEKNA